MEGEGLSVFDYRRFCGQIASVGLVGPVLLECVGRHVSGCEVCSSVREVFVIRMLAGFSVLHVLEFRFGGEFSGNVWWVGMGGFFCMVSF